MRKLIVVIVVPWTCAVGGVMSVADVSVADFPRLTGETGDSSRIMRAVDAAGRGGVVWFPRGEYEVDSMLVVSNQSSLLMHKSAHLKAVREMPFVLEYSGCVSYSPDAYDHNLFIKGGDIDGNGLAGADKKGLYDKLKSGSKSGGEAKKLAD